MSVRSMVLMAVVVTLLAVVLLWGGWLYVGHAAVRSEVRAARDAGYPMSVEALRRWHSPTSESMRAGELYQRAFEVLEDIEQPEDWVRLPYVGACESPPRGTPWPDDWFDRAEAHLAERAEARDLIHRAAALGPAWFDVDWMADDLMWIWRGLQEPLHLVALEIEWHAESGRTEDAVESLLTLWGLAVALQDDPLVVSHFRRSAFIGMAEWMTVQLLNIAPDLTSEQLRRVQDAIERIEVEAPTHRTMVGEMAWMHMQFQSGGSFGLEEGEGYGRIDTPIRRVLGLHSREHALYLRHRMEELEWFEAKRRGESPPAMRQRDVPVYAEMAEKHEDRLRMYLRTMKRPRTSRRLSMAGVAVARYRVEHGEYPDSLEALVPEYLDAVPEDPFSAGDPILYRVAETGAIVYSVGFGGVDHGGRARNDEGREDVGHSNTDITFTLGGAQAELWPEQWSSDWTPCDRIPPE